MPRGPTLCFNQLLCVNIFKTIGPLCTCYHLKGNLETEHTVPNPLPLVLTLSLSKDIKSSLHIAMIKYAALRRSAKPNPTCKSSLGSVGNQNSAMTTTLNQSLADASQHQAWASFFWQRLILVSNQRRKAFLLSHLPGTGMQLIGSSPETRNIKLGLLSNLKE